MKKVTLSSHQQQENVAINGDVMGPVSHESSAAKKTLPSQRIGNYRIVKPLGRGSMGDVFLCEHLEIPALRVALKVFNPAARPSPSLQQRFANEISTAARITHPNVIRPYEIIHTANAFAYTMEFMDGGNLAQWMKKQHNLTLERAVRMLTQLCEGIQAIHNAGFIHRDLKPENILLDQREHVRITDFAISRSSARNRSTARGSIVGTIEYLSPEYLEHGTISTLCDVYALGAIAFELFTRKQPFQSSGMYDVILEKVSSDAILADQVNPAIPRPLAMIIAKALTRNCDERFQSAEEFAHALRSLLTCSPHLAPLVLLGHHHQQHEELLPAVLSTQPSETSRLTLVKGGRDGCVVTFSPTCMNKIREEQHTAAQRRASRSLLGTVFTSICRVSLSSWLVIALVAVTATAGFTVWHLS